jgi:hypothetical protein
MQHAPRDEGHAWARLRGGARAAEAGRAEVEVGRRAHVAAGRQRRQLAAWALQLRRRQRRRRYQPASHPNTPNRVSVHCRRAQRLALALADPLLGVVRIPTPLGCRSSSRTFRTRGRAHAAHNTHLSSPSACSSSTSGTRCSGLGALGRANQPEAPSLRSRSDACARPRLRSASSDERSGPVAAPVEASPLAELGLVPRADSGLASPIDKAASPALSCCALSLSWVSGCPAVVAAF